MKKILFLISVLTISLFLIACAPAPEPTDEEIQAELAQLSDDQLESLKDDKQPLAGQGYASNSILRQTNRQRLVTAIDRERAGRLRLILGVGAACTYIGSDSSFNINGPLYGADSACSSGYCLNYSIRSFDDLDFAAALSSWGCTLPTKSDTLHCCAPMNVPSGGRCFFQSNPFLVHEQCTPPTRCVSKGICE